MHEHQILCYTTHINSLMTYLVTKQIITLIMMMVVVTMMMLEMMVVTKARLLFDDIIEFST
jgi:hypothetical protein